MAESFLLGFANKLLGDLSSTAFKKAYERVHSIRNARKELEKLEETIQTIHLVLLDAEKKQEDSALVKDWIRRVTDVLYEADNLSDDAFAADALLEEKKKGIIFKFFKRNISKDDIAKKVKDIRKSLDRISQDMNQFNFIQSGCINQVRSLREAAETESYVIEKDVFGREDEKKAIIELLLNESDAAEESMPAQVIAVVGIGGMGKTTLAQLVYNDEQITKIFQKKWWACISDVPGKAHILRTISKAMDNARRDCGPELLIREAVSSSGKYLLVLDDVWDNVDPHIWAGIMSLLCMGTKGSKIIVTTRSSSVPKAMQKDKSHIYDLCGLSPDKSWELFKAIAYTEEQEKSQEWVSVGREIVNKCANVPLAIKSIAGVLRTKDTLDEWKSIKDDELLKMESGDYSIAHALRLSYNHLHSNLKHCFAYCSLFIKDSKLRKQQLIHLWIAQGYCTQKGKTPEEIGHGYFMELLRRCFFQEVEKDRNGEISYCKMHDLIHDLAQDVAGEESIVLTEGGSRQLDQKIRHLSDERLCESWDGPPPELKTERLRSLIMFRQLVLDRRVAEFRSLRALCLESLRMSDVPSSIGELRHLRYLSLINNTNLKVLPDSITKLVNLLTLNLRSCASLIALPNDFRKLISLRHLDISFCDVLKHMPPRFGELTCLQQLSDFKVCKRGSGLDSLANMSLQGNLTIHYDSVDELMEENSEIPHTLKGLQIYSYPNMRVPTWWEKKDLPQLVKLEFIFFERVKHLPPLRCLPRLQKLVLLAFKELEYIEEKNFSSEPFFPCLRTLHLHNLQKLKGWSRQWSEDYEEQSFFPHLAILKIRRCPDLESMPRAPNLQELYLEKVGEKIVHQLVSTSNASLQRINIDSCGSLKSFPGEGLTFLRELEFAFCFNLETVQLASNVLEELIFNKCPKVELWGHTHKEEKRGLHWASLPNLRLLFLDAINEPEQLPHCLQIRTALGKLKIGKYYIG